MHKDNRLLVAEIIYATAIVLLLVLRILAGLGVFNSISIELAEILANGIIPQIIVMFGIPLLMLLASQKCCQQPLSIKQVCQDVGWHKLKFTDVLLLLVLGVCLYLLNTLIASFFASILQAFGYQYPESSNVFPGYTGLLISLLLTAVLPGFCEEFLHRGVLLSGLVKHCGVVQAIIWSSLCFGLMHMNVGQFFYATILGWVFGVTVLATGSLWSSMILHFINNALSVYLSYSREIYLPGADIIFYLFSNPLSLLLTLLVVIVAVGGIIRYFARKNFERNIDRYTVRYLASQEHFNAEDFDQVKNALPRAILRLPVWKATFAYIDTFDAPQRFRPLERALWIGILVLGSVVTCFTLIWGMW